MSNYSSSHAIRDRHREDNARIAERHTSDHAMPVALDVRPVPTKYVHLPTVDQRRPTNEGLAQYPVFQTSTMFNPGNAGGPWTGFAGNVDLESELRNQVYAFQCCPQATYIPPQSSTLYAPSLPKIATTTTSTTKTEIPVDVGYAPFNNCTRLQSVDAAACLTKK